MNTLEDAIHGRVQAIVEKVIKGLTNFITLAIDWLAKLFGFGDLNDKAQRFLERMRKPVVRGIDFALGKIAPLVNRLFRQNKNRIKQPRLGNNWPISKSAKTWNFCRRQNPPPLDRHARPRRRSDGEQYAYDGKKTTGNLGGQTGSAESR
ncbi:MAG: hypothetical protein H6574_18765 [Lewinellaceae bacterium]|nr:hypothetical protein [Lewinellaceae bacterium]